MEPTDSDIKAWVAGNMNTQTSKQIDPKKYGFGERLTISESIRRLKEVRFIVESMIDSTETFTRDSHNLHKQIDAIDNSIEQLDKFLSMCLTIRSTQ